MATNKKTGTKKTADTKKELTPKQKAQRAKAYEKAKEKRRARKELAIQRTSLKDKLSVAYLTGDVAEMEAIKARFSELDQAENALAARVKDVWDQMPDGRLIRNFRIDEHYTVEGKIDPQNGAAIGQINLMLGDAAVLSCTGGVTSPVALLIMKRRFNTIAAAYRTIVRNETTPDLPE